MDLMGLWKPPFAQVMVAVVTGTVMPRAEGNASKALRPECENGRGPLAWRRVGRLSGRPGRLTSRITLFGRACVGYLAISEPGLE